MSEEAGIDEYLAALPLTRGAAFLLCIKMQRAMMAISSCLAESLLDNKGPAFEHWQRANDIMSEVDATVRGLIYPEP